MGVPPDWMQGAVRFSLSGYTTEEEIRVVNQKAPSIVERLTGLSALGKARKREFERGDRGGRIGARR
jgi:cysteine sulfinate desulfinase/cysteine desulfurase-like protein